MAGGAEFVLPISAMRVRACDDAGVTWHEKERAALVDALRAVPYDAPTLCEGWQARHLAAHVVLREHSPRVGLELAVRPLNAWSDAAVERRASLVTDDASYAELVDEIAHGAPVWHPGRWAGELTNLTEFYVHAEDVRRGAGPVPARELEPGLVDALWGQVQTAARLRLRGVPVGVVLVRPDGVRRRVHAPKGSRRAVVVRGDVGELLLWLTGRTGAADVRFEGEPEDVAELP
jgi:uncharacterized protein (TIGR03085 family)